MASLPEPAARRGAQMRSGGLRPPETGANRFRSEPTCTCKPHLYMYRHRAGPTGAASVADGGGGGGGGLRRAARR
eukprot:scaffold1034_cov418-Prasinococcus_capsulatus_cf.AAC.36